LFSSVHTVLDFSADPGACFSAGQGTQIPAQMQQRSMLAAHSAIKLELEPANPTAPFNASVPDIFIPQLIELNAQGRFPFEKLMKFYSLDQINAAQDSENGGTIKPIIRLSPA
jgi:Zn-dependent alcohol dehydrogenase